MKKSVGSHTAFDLMCAIYVWKFKFCCFSADFICCLPYEIINWISFHLYNLHICTLLLNEFLRKEIFIILVESSPFGKKNPRILICIEGIWKRNKMEDYCVLLDISSKLNENRIKKSFHVHSSYVYWMWNRCFFSYAERNNPVWTNKFAIYQWRIFLSKFWKLLHFDTWNKF